MRFARDIEIGHEVSDAALPVPWWTTKWSFAFGPDGRRLYGLSGTGRIIALDAMTGEAIGRWEAHAGLVTTLDVQHRTGTLVSGGLDGEVRVWMLSDQITGMRGLSSETTPPGESGAWKL
jgi:hypothetical protein